MTPRITPAMVAAGRSLADPQLAPDGLHLAFASTIGGVAQLIVVALSDDPTPSCGPEVVITVDPRPIGSHPSGGGTYCWHRTGRSLVYAGRDGGLYSVPVGGGPGRLVTRPSSVGQYISPAIAPDGSLVAFVIDTGEAQQVAVARLNTEGSSEPVIVASGPDADFRIDPTWSADGRLAWHEWSVPDMPWDGGRIASVEIALRDLSVVVGPRTVLAGGPGVSVAQPRFSPLGAPLAYVGDESGWKVVRIRSTTGPGDAAAVVDEEFEHADPTWGSGQRSFCWSSGGERIAFCRNEGGFGRLCVAPIDGSFPVRELGRAVHLAPSWARTAAGHERIAAIRTGGRTPGQIVVYDVASGDRITVARGPVGGWEELDLPEPEVISWAADDATLLHGRVYRPRGVERPPMFVHIHGGPTSQTTVTFNPRVAYWLEQGWAVLVPDHRGSTGWGRAYQQAMRERWGDLDVIDCASAVRHAIGVGWCDPRRVVAMGGSAGGFTVLGLLAAYPELFAAGIDLYGVTDLIDLEVSTDRYEGHYNRSLIGPRPARDGRYRDRSPINFVEQIHAPLLVLHGDADTNVVIGQSLTLVDRMRAAGRTVELHVYDGEGHGWRRPETVVDELERIDDFLARHVPRHA